jgi:hypothetical protein
MKSWDNCSSMPSEDISVVSVIGKKEGGENFIKCRNEGTVTVNSWIA